MKVRLLSRMAGPRGNYAPGAVVDVPSEVAAALLARGHAERVDSEPETATAPEPERTTFKPQRKRRSK